MSFSISITPTTSPFTLAVVSLMRKLYPEALADKSFDNTGLLLEAPFDPSRLQKNSILLTIDLTKAVAEEAIEKKCSIVVSYHPIIFRGLKALTFADSQQSSLLRLAAKGISVYCPHTAVDTVPGGMADWLCDIMTGELDPPANVSQSSPKPSDKSSPNLETSYTKTIYPAIPSTPRSHSTPSPHTRFPIQPSPTASLDAANTHTNNTQASSTMTTYSSTNTGSGRLLTLSTPIPLPLLIDRIGLSLGSPAAFSLAIPQGSTISSHHIRTIAICPGSGSHIFSNPPAPSADLLFTGELSHHEALAHTERGGCVVTVFHSNSERGFLSAVMKAQLEGELKESWGEVRRVFMAQGGLGEGMEEVVGDAEVSVLVSERDRDPFGVVVLQQGGSREV